MITYNIPEPLFTTDLRSQVNALKAELRDQGHKLREQSCALRKQSREVKHQILLLEHSTLPVISVNLQTILDAHLMELGFSHTGSQTLAEFINTNEAAIASALGVYTDQVNHIFRVFHEEGATSAYAATSLGVADAITRGGFSSYDQSLWQRIFQRTFGRSVDDELKERGRSVWNINARWETGHTPSNRFVFVQRGQEELLHS